MKKINISTNKYPDRFVMVDDEDFEELSKWKWGSDDRGYARRNDKGTIVFMHSFLNKTPKGNLTDHIDRNPLNNQKSNLRTANKKVNSINRGLQSNNKSGYRGVYWDRNKWHAFIHNLGKALYLGRFKDLKDAIQARERAEAELWTR